MHTWRVISAWPDPLALFEALGAAVVKQRAAAGEGEAQFSQGWLLVFAADGFAGLLGVGGRSPKADVGLAPSTYKFRVAHRAQARQCGHLTI
jgi:hypothetical protein